MLRRSADRCSGSSMSCENSAEREVCPARPEGLLLAQQVELTSMAPVQSAEAFLSAVEQAQRRNGLNLLRQTRLRRGSCNRWDRRNTRGWRRRRQTQQFPLPGSFSLLNLLFSRSWRWRRDAFQPPVEALMPTTSQHQLHAQCHQLQRVPFWSWPWLTSPSEVAWPSSQPVASPQPALHLRMVMVCWL